MRVLVVAPGIIPPAVHITGLSIIYRLQQELARLGLEIHILTNTCHWVDANWKEWLENESKNSGISFHYVNNISFHRVPRLQVYVDNMALLPKVITLQRKHHFNIIHEYSSSPLLVMRTGIYRQFLNTYTIHTLCTANFSFWGNYRFLRGVGNSIDRIIAASHYIERMLIEYGFDRNKITYLPLGVEFDKFNRYTLEPNELRNKLNVSSSTFIVLYVGSLEQSKGVFTLLDAANLVSKRYEDVVFLFVIPELRLGRIRGRILKEDYIANETRFLNIIRKRSLFRILDGKQDIPSLMNLCDVLVLPLTTMHGTLAYPLTLMEGMASGKAVVASDVLGIRELITDRVNGLIVPKQDSVGLADDICELISNKGLREKLGKKAKQKVKAYDVKNIARILKLIYKSFVSPLTIL